MVASAKVRRAQDALSAAREFSKGSVAGLIRAPMLHPLCASLIYPVARLCLTQRG